MSTGSTIGDRRRWPEPCSRVRTRWCGWCSTPTPAARTPSTPRECSSRPPTSRCSGLPAKSRVQVVIDLKLLRENPEIGRASQRARGEDPALVDVLLDADKKRRAAISAADSLRAEQNAASKRVGAAAPEERPALLTAASELAAKVKAAEADQAEAEKAFTAAHMAVSNVIIDGVPAGGVDDFVVLDTVGEPPAIDNPKDHLELGESLGLIDMGGGAKVSGGS